MSAKSALSICLVLCLHLSLLLPAASQTASRRRTRPRAQVQRTDAGPDIPSVSVVSDRQLNNLLIEHRDDVFVLRIREVGLYRISGTGRGYDAFEQTQSPDGSELALSFRLLPGVMPQYVREGTQVDIYFSSSPISAAALQRRPVAPGGYQAAQPFSPWPPTTGQPATTWPAAANQPQQPGFGSRPAASTSADLPPLPPAASSAPADAVAAAADTPAAPAGPPTCRDKCNIPDSEKEGDFAIVNANDPDSFEGQRKFPRGGRVFFAKKNPYKYSYRIVCTERDIAAGIIDAFVGRIGIGDLSAFTGAVTPPGSTGGGIQPLRPGATDDTDRSACKGVDAVRLREWKAYALKLQSGIKEQADTLTQKTKDFNQAKNAYNKFLDATDTDNLDCEGACQSANALLPLLKKIDLGNMGNAIAALKDSVAALKTLTSEYKPSDPGSNKAACEAEFKLLVAAAAGYSTNVTELETKFTDLQKAINENQSKFDDLAKIINNVNAVIASGGNPFIEVRNLRADEDGKEVSCTISRKNLRVAGAVEVAFDDPVEFQVGESRISLSAGFGFSTINEIKIIRQSSLVPGEDGAPTLGTRFGFENRSKFRPSGLVLLNAHLYRFRLFRPNDTTFAFSGGLVLSNRSGAAGDGGLATEFIAGPSLGFLDNRVFTTFGFHAARVEQLGGDFKIGDPIPANLPDPLPVEKNWRNGLMFSLTYRIRPR